MTGIFLAAFSYVAALMGAGFASGQEAVAFFVSFGHRGVIGIAVASILIGAFGGLVSEYTIRHNIDYGKLTAELFSRRILVINEVVTFIFALCVEGVMCACFGELAKTIFGITPFLGSFSLAAVCAALLLVSRKNTLIINAVIGAIIFIAAASVCLYLLGYREHQTFGTVGAVSAAVSGASYAGYNLISAGTVIASGRIFLHKKWDGILCGIASGIMIFLLLIMMWGIISIYYGKIDLGELPMLTLTMRESKALTIGYAVIIGAAVLTTALSNGMCAADYLGGFLGYKKSVIICMAMGVALGGAGFSRLIGTAYRFFGAVGILISGDIICKTVKKLQKEKNGVFERKND